MATVANVPTSDHQPLNAFVAGRRGDTPNAANLAPASEAAFDDFDELANYHVAEYGKAIAALAESRYQSAYKRFMLAVVVRLRRVIAPHPKQTPPR